MPSFVSLLMALAGNSSGFWTWVQQNGKRYNTMEEVRFRQQVWEANVLRSTTPKAIRGEWM
jgi:hypothetical protein